MTEPKLDRLISLRIFPEREYEADALGQITETTGDPETIQVWAGLVQDFGQDSTIQAEALQTDAVRRWRVRWTAQLDSLAASLNPRRIEIVDSREWQCESIQEDTRLPSRRRWLILEAYTTHRGGERNA